MLIRVGSDDQRNGPNFHYWTKMYIPCSGSIARMPGWSMERVQVVIEKFKLDVQGDRHEPDVCREAEKKKKKTSATDDL